MVHGSLKFRSVDWSQGGLSCGHNLRIALERNSRSCGKKKREDFRTMAPDSLPDFTEFFYFALFCFVFYLYKS